MAMFDGAVRACREADAGTAAAMQAHMQQLRPRMRAAVQQAFADMPELSQPAGAQDVQAVRELSAGVSGQMADMARSQGAPFCQAMLQHMQAADASELAQRARAHFDNYQAKAGQDKP